LIDEVHTSSVSGYKTEFVEQAPVDRILKIEDLQSTNVSSEKTGAILLML